MILPAWTWYACYDAIVLCGALPVFAEIDASLDIDPADIESKITPRTRVVMCVHLQGCPGDMDRVLAIARRHKLRVLEDCAQCVGGRYRGRYVGTIGDVGIYSFQLGKTITAGEGGAVVTSDPVLFERAMRFHNFGVISPPYTEALKGGAVPAFAGCNFRMNEFTGAIMWAQLQKLETICSRLRANAAKVRAGIADLPGLKLRTSTDPEGDLGSTVFLDMGTRQRRDRFLSALTAEGVAGSAPGGSVDLPAHPRVEQKATAHPAWPSFTSPQGRALRYGADCCPRTTEILGRTGGVVLDPNYSEADLADIVRALRKV